MSKPATFFLLFFLGFSNVFGQNWIQKGLDMDGEAAGDESGWSISMSSDGNTLAIGADDNDGNGSSAGHVRVYSWSGSAWTQKGSDIDGEAAGDESGASVSLSSDGNTIAIGADYNDGNGTDAGHVRVYTWSGSAWTQKGSDIDGEAAGDESGWSLDMSSDGNTIAIGAPFGVGNGEFTGHVRVYSWSGSSWTQKGSDIDGEAAGDLFCIVRMSSDGNTLAIGADHNDGNGANAGHVRVFTWSGSSWTQKGSDIDGEAAGDRSGMSLSMSSDGNTVAIGGDHNDGNGADAGHVRVFTWSGSAWTQKGLDIDGEAAGDRSGWSVSMSSDGITIAIGAWANGGNGADAGHVRVYSWKGTAWEQKGKDIDGEAAGDECGTSVSMSSDGTTFAVGAEANGGNGDNAGHVRVFRYGWPAGISTNAVGKVKIYPNPSANNFTLNLGQVHQEIELIITDALGQVVSTKKVEMANRVEFEITGKQGLFLVEIRTSDSLLTTVKVIKR